MDWLTRELTPIEKVRRNVVLLATLGTLCSFFPIQTDQITFLGARFTSDVVAFGLFHGLLFYVIVLVVRAYFHERLIREAGNADAFEHASHIGMAKNTLRGAQEIIERDDRREVYDPVLQTYKQQTEDEYSPNPQRTEAERARNDAVAVMKYHRDATAFRQQGRWLVVIGEFAFPVLYGIVALSLLLLSQEVPMFWELHLRTH